MMRTPYVCNVVIDLEFTPVPRRQRVAGLRQEIIEVGAVKIAPDGSVTGKFSHMVKPTLATGVSGAVHRLTGIGNEDLTCARPLAEVLDALVAWIGPGKVRMVTWSGCDLIQLRTELAAKGTAWQLPTRWLDIQRIYPRLMGTDRRKVSLGVAADWCGIANDKVAAHRALYDAQMTAELYGMMAAGECAAHRQALMVELDGNRSECATSVASQCDGLAALLAQLRAQEAA